MSTSKGDFVDFSRVKKSVTIVQILEHYGLPSKLQQNGDKFTGPCPIHNGDNPTHFRVSISKNCWNCFGKCKRGGNILDFVSLKEGVSIREAALRIQKWLGIESPKLANSGSSDNDSPPPRKEERVEKKPQTESESRTENKPLTFSLQHLDKTHPYLAERGLTEETVTTFGLGFCNKGILADHIAIPIHNAAGQIVAYAGRWPGQPPDDKPKYKLPAGFKKSLEIFNLHRAAEVDSTIPLVVVEGYFDCMKLWQAGVKRVVALMGSTLSAAQEVLIAKTAGPNGRVVLMFDEDNAGRAGREDTLKRLAKTTFVKSVILSEEGQQPEQLTAEELQRLLSMELKGGAS
ncbi:MAG: CHC2 zinc finger domain-containing protein [Verrucomicrobiales bacterium]|nr:CHC2 zinc finger domain-containing protein [Verrucomicrobiales bacterium]